MSSDSQYDVSKRQDVLNERLTLDGKRIRLADLQVQSTEDSPESKKHWLKRCWAACNDFLAGMYTGESCAGTHHSERRNSQAETTGSGTNDHDSPAQGKDS